MFALAQARDAWRSEPYQRLCAHPWPDAEPFPVLEVFDALGFDDALWALSYADERAWHLLACDFVEHVLPIFEEAYPDDARPALAIAAARRYAMAIGPSDIIGRRPDARIARYLAERGGEAKTAARAAGEAAVRAWRDHNTRRARFGRAIDAMVAATDPWAARVAVGEAWWQEPCPPYHAASAAEALGRRHVRPFLLFPDSGGYSQAAAWAAQAGGDAECEWQERRLRALLEGQAGHAKRLREVALREARPLAQPASFTWWRQA